MWAQVAAIERLLELGAEVDAQDSEGLTPLLMAAVAGREAAVVALANRGADPGLAHLPGTGLNVLHICADAGGGMRDAVAALLKDTRGRALALGESNRMRPIHLAALSGDMALVRAATQQGVDNGQLRSRVKEVTSVRATACGPSSWPRRRATLHWYARQSNE
jgi:ankyrin repeat protein